MAAPTLLGALERLKVPNLPQEEELCPVLKIDAGTLAKLVSEMHSTMLQQNRILEMVEREASKRKLEVDIALRNLRSEFEGKLTQEAKRRVNEDQKLQAALQRESIERQEEIKRLDGGITDTLSAAEKHVDKQCTPLRLAIRESSVKQVSLAEEQKQQQKSHRELAGQVAENYESLSQKHTVLERDAIHMRQLFNLTKEEVAAAVEAERQLEKLSATPAFKQVHASIAKLGDTAQYLDNNVKHVQTEIISTDHAIRALVTNVEGDVSQLFRKATDAASKFEFFSEMCSSKLERLGGSVAYRSDLEPYSRRDDLTGFIEDSRKTEEELRSLLDGSTTEREALARELHKKADWTAVMEKVDKDDLDERLRLFAQKFYDVTETLEELQRGHFEAEAGASQASFSINGAAPPVGATPAPAAGADPPQVIQVSIPSVPRAGTPGGGGVPPAAPDGGAGAVPATPTDTAGDKDVPHSLTSPRSPQKGQVQFAAWGLEKTGEPQHATSAVGRTRGVSVLDPAPSGGGGGGGGSSTGRHVSMFCGSGGVLGGQGGASGVSALQSLAESGVPFPEGADSRRGMVMGQGGAASAATNKKVQQINQALSDMAKELQAKLQSVEGDVQTLDQEKVGRRELHKILQELVGLTATSSCNPASGMGATGSGIAGESTVAGDPATALRFRCLSCNRSAGGLGTNDSNSGQRYPPSAVLLKGEKGEARRPTPERSRPGSPMSNTRKKLINYYDWLRGKGGQAAMSRAQNLTLDDVSPRLPASPTWDGAQSGGGEPRARQCGDHGSAAPFSIGSDGKFYPGVKNKGVKEGGKDGAPAGAGTPAAAANVIPADESMKK